MNHLGDDGMGALLPGLAANQESLQVLALASGGMTSRGLQALGSCLASNTFKQLCTLVLYNNDFSKSFLAFARDVLKYLPALEWLIFERTTSAMMALRLSLRLFRT